ncbi:MAG: immunoglobulin E-set [Benjaminiella poitrasii]|nr:MAG: immunoglobulin E-set [Benjaminiella poitrasii]
MPIQLYSKSGAEVYHHRSKGEDNEEKYSIFGHSNKAMDYAYVPISNIKRNNRGFYKQSKPKDPSYYHQNITKLENKIHIGVPVWTLHDPVQQQEVKKHHNVTFIWPYGGKNVILTGDFDNWQGTVSMTPVNSELFKAEIDDSKLNNGAIQYKFIVDGKWCYDSAKNTVKDSSGNVNNVFYYTKN